jgi:tryptophan-rich sensory protein
MPRVAALPDGLRQQPFRKNNFAGMENINTYKKYLYHLRPWDSTPSPMYIEELEKRNWWHLNPPSLMRVLVYLLMMMVVQFVVAFLPLVSNWYLLNLRWTGYQQPNWAYTQGWLLLSAWCIINALNAVAVWFVYLDGGLVDQRTNFYPYFALLMLEAVWSDVIFGANLIACTLFVWLAMLALSLVCVVKFYRVAIVAGAFVVPSSVLFLYGIIYLGGLWALNGAVFTPMVT